VSARIIDFEIGSSIFKVLRIGDMYEKVL
jgi:hypothetical protein